MEDKVIQGRTLASRIGAIFLNLILMIFSLTCVFPIIWLFYASLKSKSEFYANPVSLPRAPSLEHYITILTQSSIFVWMMNTVRNTAISLVLIIIMSFVAAYFLSRFKFKGRKFLYTYLMLGMLVPIHALMIPMYILFSKMGIGNSWYTLVLPYTAFGLPMSIFLIEVYIRSIPKEVEEAASIDGASFNRILFRIVMPMCKPILATVAIIQFFYCWNEFTFSLILISKENLMTMPVGLTLFKGQYSADYPSMIAGMLISILPASVIYFIFSKQIIRGMVSGAVKG